MAEDHNNPVGDQGIIEGEETIITLAGSDAGIDSGSAEQRTELGDTPPRKRRGRLPRAASGATKAKKATLALNRKTFARQLSAAHGIAAHLTGQPVWALTDDEADLLADSILGVLEQYDIKIGARALAWGNLVAALAAVYGTRVLMIQALKSTHKRSYAKTDGAKNDGKESKVVSIDGIPVV